MSKKIAIIQSNYIPWKGYFDMIDQVNEFILFDDAQYTKNDWRNRNKIKTPQGVKWLTIPVLHSGRFGQKINETEIVDPGWNHKHWKTLQHAYSNAPSFHTFADDIEELYSTAKFRKLSDINYHFIKGINRILDIKTEITWSSGYTLTGGKTERLVNLCKQAGATEYISGPSARSYLDTAPFEEQGIKVTWMDYSGYKTYPQLYNSFEHSVTVLDLIFCTGTDARNYLKR